MVPVWAKFISFLHNGGQINQAPKRLQLYLPQGGKLRKHKG